MANNGWVKLHRTTLNNPIVMKDADHLAVWVWLLMNVTHSETDVVFKGKRITLKPGEITTGRKIIASELQISESKVQRILESFESEHQIEQQKSNKCRLISVVNWGKYQTSEQQSEQQLNNKWTTSEQQLNTKQEYKNEKNEKKYTYGCFGNVFLTDEEYESLKAEFTNFKERIDALSEYMESTGRKYKSHYATIKAWARKEPKEIKPKSHKAFKEEYYERDDFKAEQMPEEVRQRLNTIGKAI